MDMEKGTEKDYVKVAVMYYDEGLTQAEIAKMMNVSRSLVSKMLIDAREAKIIEVFINSQSILSAKLERELEEKYGLLAAVVVDTEGLTATEIPRKVGKEAAIFFESYIKRNPNVRKIGVSWGKSLRHLVDYISFSYTPDMDIYPLVGGMGTEHFNLHSNQLVQCLSQKLKAKAHYLYVPAMVSSNGLREELKNDSTISSVMKESREVDFAMLGVAALTDDSTLVTTGYINMDELEELRKNGNIGDINSQFFNQKGEAFSELNQRVMGLSIEEIKKIPVVAAISHGKEKIEAIKVGLDNQFFNILITTDVTAREILQNIEN